MNTKEPRLGGMLVQMSGAPGSGKSTLTRELVRRLRLVALDHDVTKSALLAHRPFDAAGVESYAVLKALADDLLTQGHSVVIDSPCLYEALLASGQALAARHAVAYRYIECVASLELLDERLRSRPAQPSQLRRVDVPQFEDWIANMKRPPTYLRLDTTRPLDACVTEALAYLTP